MTRKPGGRNNAFKHGAFAQDLILSGENREDFEQLYQSLVDELKPQGTLEDDTVLTLAKCIWAKRRVERFYQQEGVWAQEHPDDEEELNDVYLLARALDGARTFESANEILAGLPETYRSSLEKSVPQSAYRGDVDTYLGHLKSHLRELIEIRELTLPKLLAGPKFKAEQAARLSELTAKKIAMDEKLDAMIDKAIKRLAQLKMFKEVIESQASRPKAVEHHSIHDQRQ